MRQVEQVPRNALRPQTQPDREEEVALAGGPKPLRIEGQETLTWVLMDYGAFVVHVFSAEARDYYDLERLWKDVPRLTDVA